METIAPNIIVDGNTLIAKFMGYTTFSKRYPRNHGIGGNRMEEPKHCIVEKLKYHSSWDLLMPVIKKCWTVNLKGGWMKGDRIESRININDFFGDNIMEVHSQVVEFIKWYNTQPK